MMVIEAVRNAVGKDFPIEMRISTEECISSDKRLPLDDVITFIQHAEPYIDIVNCSRGLDMIREANIHHAATILNHILQTWKHYAKSGQIPPAFYPLSARL